MITKEKIIKASFTYDIEGRTMNNIYVGLTVEEYKQLCEDLDKLEKIKILTNLKYKERREISKEYLEWCNKNNVDSKDTTNMVTWFLCIKLKEVI